MRCPTQSIRRRLLQALAAIAIGTAARGIHAADVAFDLRVQNGRVPASMRLVRVKEGDIVTLRWFADRPLLLHLHGYDIEWRLQAGVVGKVTFTARMTGRFPIHAHDTGNRTDVAHDDASLVYVEVYPR